MGLHPVCSLHIGLYNYHNSAPTEEAIEDLSVRNTVQCLVTPSDGNLTSTKSYGQFSDQLDVVDSPHIPLGILFVDTIPFSAAIGNLATLMKVSFLWLI